MIHNAWGVSIGDYKALRKDADISENLSKLLLKKYVSKTKRAKDTIKSEMEEETYFYGEEIVDNGFGDVLLKSEAEDEQAQTKEQMVAIVGTQLKEVKAYLKTKESEDDLELVAKTLDIQIDNIQAKQEAEQKEKQKQEQLATEKKYKLQAQARARELQILEKEVQIS